MTRPRDQKDASASSPEALRADALALIRSQRTMVVATCLDDTPWSAPVYYVFHAGAFFFFSSPKSLHVHQITANPRVSATIFMDGEHWRDLQGLQMSGVVNQVTNPAQLAAVTARYLLRHTFAREFISDAPGKNLDLRDKVRMYGFIPQTVYFVNNRNAFGQRVLIRL